MNREFLDLYNRELKLLQEQAREFASAFRLENCTVRTGLLETLRDHHVAATVA